MEQLELRWSRKKLVLYLAGGVAFVVFGALAQSEPLWERALAAAFGVAACVFVVRRLQATGDPVLVLSREGVRDVRLTPSFLPWSAIRTIEYEPKYARGGAIVLQLGPGAPVPEVRNPQAITRGQEATRAGQTLRLTLGDLAFTPGVIRSAIAEFGSRAQSRAV